jgi:hypothetical protein
MVFDVSYIHYNVYYVNCNVVHRKTLTQPLHP